MCCSVLQCVSVCTVTPIVEEARKAFDGSMLQCVAVYFSVLQCGAMCCSVLQCVAVCCSVLQCVAVCTVTPIVEEAREAFNKVFHHMWALAANPQQADFCLLLRRVRIASHNMSFPTCVGMCGKSTASYFFGVIYIHTFAQTRTHTRTHTQAPRTHTHTHTHTHTQTHSNTHTNTRINMVRLEHWCALSLM